MTVDIVRARYLDGAARVDLPHEFTADFFDLMIAATCRAEDELMDALAARGDWMSDSDTESPRPVRESVSGRDRAA